MRLLLDEQVPRVFADELPGHEVFTAQEMGWSGIENGDLLAAAAGAGFEALITLDRGIEFQQNLATLPMAVVVVKAQSNRIEALQPLAPDVSSKLWKGWSRRLLFTLAYDSRVQRTVRPLTRWLSGSDYFGGMRSAPSRRITSALR